MHRERPDPAAPRGRGQAGTGPAMTFGKMREQDPHGLAVQCLKLGAIAQLPLPAADEFVQVPAKR